MECRLDKDLIQEYLDGSLGQIESMILEEHFKTCESCKDEYEAMASLFHDFYSLKSDVDLPEGLPLLRNQVLNGIMSSDTEAGFGMKKFLKAQEAAFKGAGIFTQFVPGIVSGGQYIKKGIKKTPGILYKTLSFAFRGSMKIMSARVKL